MKDNIPFLNIHSEGTLIICLDFCENHSEITNLAQMPNILKDLSIKESNTNEKSGSKFSHLLTVRARVVESDFRKFNKSRFYPISPM